MLSTTDGAALDTSYPPLPLALDLMCQLLVDEDTLLVIGGRYNGSHTSARTFRLRLGEQQWTEHPAMSQARGGPGCGVVSVGSEPRYVVVAGGTPGVQAHAARKLDSVEVLNLKTMRWRQGELRTYVYTYIYL